MAWVFAFQGLIRTVGRVGEGTYAVGMELAFSLPTTRFGASHVAGCIVVVQNARKPGKTLRPVGQNRNKKDNKNGNYARELRRKI